MQSEHPAVLRSNASAVMRDETEEAIFGDYTEEELIEMVETGEYPSDFENTQWYEPVAFIGDLLGVLEIGATYASFLLKGVAAFSVGLIGSVAGLASFLIAAITSWISAWEARDRWAAAQGAAYATVSVAKGEQTPGPHSYFSDKKDSWEDGISNTEDDLKQAVKDGDMETVGGLYQVWKGDGEEALNVVHQDIVEEDIQEHFLGLIPAGGQLYAIARRTYLRWPGPGHSMGEEDLVNDLLEQAE